MGASTNVPDLRKDRLLRFLPQSTREQACPRGSSSSAPFSRAGRRLVVVCDRRGHLRSARLSGAVESEPRRRIGRMSNRGSSVRQRDKGWRFRLEPFKIERRGISKMPQYMMLIYTPTEGGP